MQGRTQGGVEGVDPPPTPFAINQTKVPYPKPLKHSNKTKS